MSKPSHYAVHTGRERGVYKTWHECEKQVKGFPGARYKKFSTLQAAEAFIQDGSMQHHHHQHHQDVSRGNAVVVYTDGSALSNGEAGCRAGVGVFFGEDDPRNIAERLGGVIQTNQRAELMAVVRALEVLSGEIEIEIRTDSMYVINIVTVWGARWRSNGWKRTDGPVLNLDIIRPLLDKIDQRPGPITWTHVKAHNGEPGNEAADKLAQQGARS